MDYETIKCSESDNIATIMLNRPEKRNAVNETMIGELLDYISYCEENTDIKAIIVTGSGKAFCSGGDLDQMDFSHGSTHLRVKTFINAGHPLFLEMRRVPKPIIAAVNGPAIGAGFGLALSCDLLIASKSARFNSHFVLVGLSPDGGLSYLLPRLVGDKRAKWLMFTGEVVDAQKGYEIGFVNKVVEDIELLNEATSVAKKLASSATLAIARTKELINRSWYESLETQMEYEKQFQAGLVLTEDAKEAITAFRDKRKPRFKGC
jgi:2-(1,2-epoxy-1,2-dihydrophenyl)acetyl-CoA isomerase